MTPEDWRLIGFYLRVSHETRQAPVPESEKESYWIILDVASVHARLVIDGVPKKRWAAYLEAATFLHDLEHGRIPFDSYPRSLLDADR